MIAHILLVPHESTRDAAPLWHRPSVSHAIADVERARAAVRRLAAGAP